MSKNDWFVEHIREKESRARYPLTPERMLEELEANRLEVVLVQVSEPKHHGQQLRAVQSQNAKWYQDLCAEYQSTRGKMRRPRTYVDRRVVINSLKKMIAGKSGGVYVERLWKFIEQNRFKYS